jgi:hypothetical protein
MPGNTPFGGLDELGVAGASATAAHVEDSTFMRLAHNGQ